MDRQTRYLVYALLGLLALWVGWKIWSSNTVPNHLYNACMANCQCSNRTDSEDPCWEACHQRCKDGKWENEDDAYEYLKQVNSHCRQQCSKYDNDEFTPKDYRFCLTSCETGQRSFSRDGLETTFDTYQKQFKRQSPEHRQCWDKCFHHHGASGPSGWLMETAACAQKCISNRIG